MTPSTQPVTEITTHVSGATRVRIGRQPQLPPYFSLSVVDSSSSTAKAKTKSGLTNPQITLTPDKILVRLAYAPTDVVYGLGEKTGWLDKRHRRYQMRTADVWWEHPAGIGLTTDPLYASFPFFIIHNPKSTYGIFVDNPEFTEFDFTADDSYEFSAPADTLTYYILPGPTLPAVLQQYTTLTGHLPLPALWTLGYHQCRWGYKDEADIRQVTSELRQRKHPADGIWFDIDYMDGYRVFTWDKVDFPNPKELLADLNHDGFHAVTIVDPGVKVDDGYRVYQEGQAGDHFVKHSDGREYNGSVWPGRSAFPDFHHTETRNWWAGLASEWMSQGLSGLWNDMNEPASTDITGSIEDTRHNGLPHAAARNTYALQMARATYQGLLQHDPDSRPFILTRAAFSGAQTVAALWAGDNHAYWEHLAGSIPLLLNLGLSGMPFVGVDIGGFGGDTNGELLARWTQLGAFYPFCRNHAAAGTRVHEPWALGPHVEAICRRYIELRYQLLPYFYNLFREASLNGTPIWRPLAWHYPKDKSVLNLNDQLLVGRDLLLAPILAPGATGRGVYLPKGTWYRWGTDEAFTGPTRIAVEAPLTEMPIFVRGGSIIPMWPLAQHTGALNRAQSTLHVWPGDGKLEYYEDDGLTRAFERGSAGWRTTTITVKQTKSKLTLKFAKPKGSYNSGRKEWKVVVHPANKTIRVPDDGQAREVTIKV